MQNGKAYQLIATMFQAWINCIASNNLEWRDRHRNAINQIVDLVMPHGSGIDGAEIALDFDSSHSERLHFVNVDFHHMNENGYYAGWSEHSAIVTPSLANGFSLNITGRDRNEIKDYLYEMLDVALRSDLVWSDSRSEYIQVDRVGYAMDHFAHALRHPLSERSETRKTCGMCC